MTSPTGSDTTSTGSGSAASSPRTARDLAPRLLRCIDTVEISGTALNWDAKPCFVVLVSMRDSDARRKAYARGGGSARSGAPFQIERTKAELTKLLRAIQQCCGKLHTTNKDKPCAFCAPVVSGAVVVEALRVAHEAAADDTEATAVPSGCFGFLGSAKMLTTPRASDEWAAWLNACVAHVRHHARVDEMPVEDQAAACEGQRRVPELLAQCLLEGFTTVTSP